MDSLDALAAFRKQNVRRCLAVYRAIEDWSPMQWAAALTGEASELCNAATKYDQAAERRAHAGFGEITDAHKEAVLREMADVYAYLDLLAERLEVGPHTLWMWICRKFNEKSAAIAGVGNVAYFVDEDPWSKRGSAAEAAIAPVSPYASPAVKWLLELARKHVASVSATSSERALDAWCKLRQAHQLILEAEEQLWSMGVLKGERP